MDHKQKDQVATFRYGIIAPLISKVHGHPSLSSYFKTYGGQEYATPNGEKVFVSPQMIERWYYAYQKYGYEGLAPKSRSDEGLSRKLDGDIVKSIDYYMTNYPKIPATSILTALEQKGIIEPNSISLSTIGRFVKRLKKDRDLVVKKDMRRYEAEHVNDIWCCDTCYTDYLFENGERKRTYTIAILDDASRMIVGVGLFFNDNYVNFLSVLKEAVESYGRPKLLNLDNGTPYKNGQIATLSARIGVTLHYNAPYEPVGKAKVERFFRTMREHFWATYHITSRTSLAEASEALKKYCYEYNHRIHSSLGTSPFERFFNGKDQIIRLEERKIETSFLLEIERTVTADRVIVIDNVQYEVPLRYARRKITLRYSPDFSKVYSVDKDGSLEEIELLDKIANSKMKRRQPILRIEKEEENV